MLNKLPAADNKSHHITLWVKLLTTCFLGVLVPVYWQELGPANFLWFCDIALITLTVALWLENRFLVSMMAVGTLLPELAWNIDFFSRLLVGSHLFGLGATSYMFETQKVVWQVRTLSFLFHVYLPIISLWSLYRLGYHPKAWRAQTALAWVVLPLCYLLTDPEANINWVFGFGREPQQWLPGPVYVGLLMLLFPLVVYLPTHLVLNRLFDRSRDQTTH